MITRFKKEKGASAVEFAFIILVLVPLIFGIIQFSPAFFSAISLTHAAREVVRRVAVEDIEISEVEEAVLENIPQYVKDWVASNGEIIEVDSSEEIDAIGEEITVDVTILHTFNIPLMPALTKALTGHASMRQEQ